MDSKMITYSAVGFVSGIVFIFFIGVIGMSGMMWGGHRGMMGQWFRGSYQNCPAFQANPN